MKDKTKDKKAINILLILAGIFILMLVIIPSFTPSEEELCDEAIDEAKYFLDESTYELNEWMTYEYSLKDEYIASITITNTDCDVWDRNDIEVTFDLDIKTSKDRYAHIEAIVSVIDGYADYIEFNSGLL